MKRMRMVLTVCFVILMATAIAYAVPSLGVGTDSYVNGTDPYQTYWGGSTTGSGEGFLIGASGSDLHVWSNILGSDIYVLTTADVYANNNILFGGAINEYDVQGQFESYAPTPYYGVDLGPVNTATWDNLTADAPTIWNPKDFYSINVEVTYNGSIGADQWIFAAADTNGLAGLQASPTKVGDITYAADTWLNWDGKPVIPEDSTSPKTTAARGGNQVPEPSTIWLMGMGLAGLGIYRRKRS